MPEKTDEVKYTNVQEIEKNLLPKFYEQEAQRLRAEKGKELFGEELATQSITKFAGSLNVLS